MTDVIDNEHDFANDPVWGDVWNPTPNTWSPSDEPFPAYGQDAATVRYQDHGDHPTAEPITEMPGFPPSGTVPEAGMNLLTDVKHPTSAPAPTQIIQHEVHTYETGSEIARVRQVVVNGTVNGVTPGNLLEANPKRKRALLRILPSDPAQTGQVANFTGGAGPLITTVPAGKSWAVTNISFLYTADANPANRNVRVRITDAAGRNLYTFVDSTALTLSQTGQVSLAPGNPTQHTLATGSAFIIQGNLPAGLVVPAGGAVLVDALGSDAGDTITLGSIQFTGQTISGAVVQSGTALFIAPRDEGGALTAVAQSWWKLVAGDGPLELKTQSGIDVMNEAATDIIVLQVYEELIDGNVQLPPPGIV